MKRILPIVLILAMLLLALVSCGPKKETATSTETAEEVTTKKITTTSKILDMGIEAKDEGWSFWNQF